MPFVTKGLRTDWPAALLGDRDDRGPGWNPAELPSPTLAIIAAVFESLAIAIPVAERAICARCDRVRDHPRTGSIVQGTLPLHLFGKEGYGELVGRIASVRMIGSAVAPFVCAFLMEKFDATWALGLTAVLGVGAFANFLWISRLVAQSRKAASGP